MSATNELLRKWLEKFGDAWDAGPPREGWQSDELLALIEQTRSALSATEEIGRLRAELETLKQGIDASAWHYVAGEPMKRILVAKSAIARIEAALKGEA